MRDALSDGFYIAKLRDEVILCYVYKRKSLGTAVALLPNGRTLSISDEPIKGKYILRENLRPANPSDLEDALKVALETIEFIYTNRGRLLSASE